MATANFSYEHRCVVVTNEDYEDGNLPQLGDWHSRPYGESRREVEVNESLNFFYIALVPGYYEAACIDYYEKDECRGIYDFTNYASSYDSVKEFFRDVQYYFNISTYRLRKLMGKRGQRELWKWIEDSYDAIDAWLMQQEEKVCNAILDRIKSDYGYLEYAKLYQFSNGETGYYCIDTATKREALKAICA